MDLKSINTLENICVGNIWFVLFPGQFEQADEATRNRKVLEIEKEDNEELQQKYQV